MVEMLQVVSDLRQVSAKFENPALAIKNSGLVAIIATTCIFLCVND